MTIAYALQGHDIPDGIERRYCSGGGERISPGPGFLGGAVERDWVNKNLPPDAWFACLSIVARFAPPMFSAALEHLPEKLPTRTDLFSSEADADSVTFEDACNLADMWVTIWNVLMSGKIVVATESQLRDVRKHHDTRKATAESVLGNLRRSLNDEHRLIWKLDN